MVAKIPFVLPVFVRFPSHDPDLTAGSSHRPAPICDGATAGPWLADLDGVGRLAGVLAGLRLTGKCLDDGGI